MELDTYNKNEARKFEVFSQVLHAHTKHFVLDYRMDGPPELKEDMYFEYIRPLLYEIYHLLDDSIVREIDKIEYIHEKQSAMLDEDEGDLEALTKNYQEIIKIIKQEFVSLRKSRKENM
ncbi:Uncharacterised protein [Streptococcus pneumoniae]|nr:Uncharacterised protein [Streptococcus pneumoniae]